VDFGLAILSLSTLHTNQWANTRAWTLVLFLCWDEHVNTNVVWLIWPNTHQCTNWKKSIFGFHLDETQFSPHRGLGGFRKKLYIYIFAFLFSPFFHLFFPLSLPTLFANLPFFFPLSSSLFSFFFLFFSPYFYFLKISFPFLLIIFFVAHLPTYPLFLLLIFFSFLEKQKSFLCFLLQRWQAQAFHYHHLFNILYKNFFFNCNFLWMLQLHRPTPPLIYNFTPM
jgi:hypothetical protein